MYLKVYSEQRLGDYYIMNIVKSDTFQLYFHRFEGSISNWDNNFVLPSNTINQRNRQSLVFNNGFIDILLTVSPS